jgi:hypothetical protein
MEYLIGVNHTTSDQSLSQIMEFPGYFIDIRKTNVLPSAFEGIKRSPAKRRGILVKLGGWDETKGQNPYLKT